MMNFGRRPRAAHPRFVLKTMIFALKNDDFALKMMSGFVLNWWCVLRALGNNVASALRDREICAVCGSGGPVDGFIFCTQCGESYRKWCLHENFALSDDVLCDTWVCLACMRCAICDSHEREENMVACDICDRGYHVDCLSPPLTVDFLRNHEIFEWEIMGLNQKSWLSIEKCGFITKI